MAFISHRENSKTNWGKTTSDQTNPDRDDIQLGCLLRIADATEAMAKYHVQIIKDRDLYERLYRDSQAGSRKLERQNAALRGVITKLKKAKP